MRAKETIELVVPQACLVVEGRFYVEAQRLWIEAASLSVDVALFLCVAHRRLGRCRPSLR